MSEKRLTGFGPLRRYIGIGASDGLDRNRRGHEIVNVVSLAAVLSNTAFAAAFAAADFANYRPIVLALCFFSVAWLFTPFLHRFGELAAGTYLWATAGIGNAVYAWLAGADAGFQFFLLAGPGILVMVLGSKRALLAALYFVVLILVFVIVELTFPRRSSVMDLSSAVATFTFLSAICMSAVINLVAAFFTFRRAEQYEEAFEAEHQRSEQLLLNLVPASIAERLKHRPNEIIADTLPAVTILFADIVGFTQRASTMPADRLVAFLNRIFQSFDRLAEQHGLEKIKTIGDAYMLAGGMPEQRADHASAVAGMALGMQAIMGAVSAEIGETVAVRIGIHSGAAIAGVIGQDKLFYDVWGDTVNVAARMESHGEPGRIQVSRAARDAIGAGFVFIDRGLVKIKGKGDMQAFWLEGRVEAVSSRQ